MKDKRGVSVNDDHGAADTSTTVKDLREKIADLELRLELIDSELQETTAQMPKDIKSSEQDIDEAVTTLMKGMSTCALKSILLETFSKFVEAEVSYYIISRLMNACHYISRFQRSLTQNLTKWFLFEQTDGSPDRC